jgi:hypothetical protein
VLALVSALAAGYLLVLGSSIGREFFALSRPNVVDALVEVLASAGGIWLLTRIGLSPFPRTPGGRLARRRERAP